MVLNVSALQLARENHVENVTKTCVITGCSSGIGLATLLAMAPHGWKVICAVRDVAKMQTLLQSQKEEVRNNCHVRKLDLDSFASVKEFAQNLLQDFPQLDALICNAGLFPFSWEVTGDGYERCFQACHLSHHLLVRLLESSLVRNSRVIFVSSHIHTFFPAKEYDWPNKADDASSHKGFGSDNKASFTQMGMPLYAQAKLANVHDALIFGKRLEERGVLVYSVHPGGVDTGIWPWYMKGIKTLILLSADQGAAPSVFLATNPQLGPSNGDGKGAAYKPGMYFCPSHFYKPPHQEPVSALGANEQVAQRLWDETEKIVNAYL